MDGIVVVNEPLEGCGVVLSINPAHGMDLSALVRLAQGHDVSHRAFLDRRSETFQTLLVYSTIDESCVQSRKGQTGLAEDREPSCPLPQGLEES